MVESDDEELLRRLESIRDQGELARVSGKTDVELGLREQASDILIELYGPDSREALRARGQIGLALIASRRFAEAEKLFSDLLLLRADILGPNDEETFSTRGNLAKSIAWNGRPNEALLVLRRLYADRVRLLGERHETTLSTRGMIAHTLLLAGDIPSSILAYEELLEDQIAELGENHPDVAVTLSNLTVIRSRNSDPDSIRQQEELVAEYVRDHGDGDPQTLAQKHLLAETYLHSGRHDQALALIGEVFTHRNSTLGELDPGTLAARGLRARIKAKSGHLDEASTELLSCLQGWAARGADNEIHALGSLADTICLIIAELPHVDTQALRSRQTICEMLSRLRSSVSGFETSHPLRLTVDNIISLHPEFTDEGDTP